MDELIDYSKEDLLKELWKIHPRIKSILKEWGNLKITRKAFFLYLNNLENHYFNIFSEKRYKDMHILERNNAKECIRVLKNVIRTENEQLTKFSALKILRKLARNHFKYLDRIDEGFLVEFIYLFNGIKGQSTIRSMIYTTLYTHPEPIKNAQDRSNTLDQYANEMNKYFGRYKVGYDPDLVKMQKRMKEKIQLHFNADELDWQDWQWHLKNVIFDVDTLKSLVSLSPKEIDGLEYAKRYDIPFFITPHYLSLFQELSNPQYDHAVRAQVLPSKTYCVNVEKSRKEGASMDFMDEASTSPIEGVTRRYPQILILKPFDSCPQMCVYCQRNWEMKDIHNCEMDNQKTEKAIEWIANNPTITEVLVTGGDPLTLKNDVVDKILTKLSQIDHVQRIRIGSRTLVTLPFRIDDGLIQILDRTFDIGKLDISFITHFEHPVEFTYDSLEAVKKIKKLGMNIYNQQVYTYYNSRKYETCLLRKVLKKSGIDPYYTFNTKGKEETIDYRVPIPRICQERKEEARLLPGLDRTDEPVFNVPGLGKSHLRAWQDHEPIMINAEGCRVYRFYPWEARIALVNDYIYTDVSILKYLKRLKQDGEDVEGYKSIWYYF